ncbi:hypothetical protein [Amycolatopsis sp. WQ 127309]|uniref:hypothetical protein n=1 Tax=Amycolatopsis sp. WQ 127309 TaxID=2932773 RepID=UPI001FF3EA94|nr:hypothetical protein [Amycolatopsis sp. WQ 127309]UOZ09632.1 hypothetical protein MUY22_15720 [Amycolatopsis sp. WQ 127309]
MKRLAARVLLPLAAATALTGLAGGVAGADPTDGSVWVGPGLDLGSVLGPVGLLAPVFGLITAIS